MSTHAQKQERSWDVHGTKKRLGAGEEEGGEERQATEPGQAAGLMGLPQWALSSDYLIDPSS